MVWSNWLFLICFSTNSLTAEWLRTWPAVSGCWGLKPSSSPVAVTLDVWKSLLLVCLFSTGKLFQRHCYSGRNLERNTNFTFAYTQFPPQKIWGEPRILHPGIKTAIQNTCISNNCLRPLHVLWAAPIHEVLTTFHPISDNPPFTTAQAATLPTPTATSQH